MALAQQRFSTDLDVVFSLAGEAVTEAALAAGDRDAVFASHLGPVEEAIHRFCTEPNESTSARLTDTVADFRAVRRSAALARWRGLATRPQSFRKVTDF